MGERDFLTVPETKWEGRRRKKDKDPSNVGTLERAVNFLVFHLKYRQKEILYTRFPTIKKSEGKQDLSTNDVFILIIKSFNPSFLFSLVKIFRPSQVISINDQWRKEIVDDEGGEKEEKREEKARQYKVKSPPPLADETHVVCNTHTFEC